MRQRPDRRKKGVEIFLELRISPCTAQHVQQCRQFQAFASIYRMIWWFTVMSGAKKLLHKMHSPRAEIAKNSIATIQLNRDCVHQIGPSRRLQSRLAGLLRTHILNGRWTDQHNTRLHAFLCGVTVVQRVDRTNANETGTVPRLPQPTVKRKRDLYSCT